MPLAIYCLGAFLGGAPLALLRAYWRASGHAHSAVLGLLSLVAGAGGVLIARGVYLRRHAVAEPQDQGKQ